MRIDPKTKKLKADIRQGSKLFISKEEFEHTPEQILEACPEVIPSSSISLDMHPDKKRKMLIEKYKAKGKKYKWWTQDDKIRAATLYAMTGSSKKVEEISGIPGGTVRQWRTESWWPQIIDRIRQEGDDQLDVKLTGLIDKVTDEINDRLQKGDYIYDTKKEKIVRKPIAGKDLSVMTSIFVDKRALLRKKPKMMGETSTVNERLKKLAEEFSKFVSAKTIVQEKENDQEMPSQQIQEAREYASA